MRPFPALAMALAAGLAAATPASGNDEPREDRADYREGYRRGYDDGFASGYRKGLEEAGRNAPAAAPPPPPPPPRPTGPITASTAYYGSTSKSCHATRWVAKRSEDMPRVHAVAAFKVPLNVTRSFAMRIPPEAVRLVRDTPAAMTRTELIDVTRDADKILVPVLPSDIDIHACSRCVRDLLLVDFGPPRSANGLSSSSRGPPNGGCAWGAFGEADAASRMRLAPFAALRAPQHLCRGRPASILKLRLHS